MCATPGSNSKGAHAKQVVHEAANLKTGSIKKVGEPYVERLRSDLGGMGVSGDVVDQYLRTLAGAFEGTKKEREWRNFFAQFVERAMSGRT